MKSSFHISLFLLFFSVTLSGQVIDTAKKINTWKLMHHFTRFEETPLDTNLHQIQRDYQPAFKQGFSYEYTGNLGDALNHVDFFLRPDPDLFLFGRAWEPYLKNAERTVFFNTKTPFTSLSYSIIPTDWREENVEALHTQNFSPYTNFGIDFNILAGKDLYTHQKTKVNRIGMFGSHARERYSIFGTFYYNDFVVEENGGLKELDPFLEGQMENLWEYEMNLSNAGSHYRNLSLFLTHKYNLVERQYTTDSLGNTTTTGKTFSLSHQLSVERQFKDYHDQVDPVQLSPFYNNYYYEVAFTKDSASEERVSNQFQLILGDPDRDRISARVYAGHEFRRFGALSHRPFVVYSHLDTVSYDPVQVDTVYRDSMGTRFEAAYYNDIYVGFHLAGPTTGRWDWVVDGSYYLLGYYRHDFQVNATFSRELADRAELGIRGSLSLKKPHYFTNHYASSFFTWENQFPAQFRIKGEAFVSSEEMEMEARAGAALIRDYIYWDQEALPQLYDGELMVFSGYFSKHFTVSGYNSETKLLLQYTTGGDVLPLPLAALYTSNYWDQSLFKGALIADIGFDFYYTTKYYASAYMPATGQFYLQDQYRVGGYPFLDLFLALKIKSTRIFFSYSNLLQGVGKFGNDYFTAYGYPLKPRNIRLGLVWIFYD